MLGKDGVIDRGEEAKDAAGVISRSMTVVAGDDSRLTAMEVVDAIVGAALVDVPRNNTSQDDRGALGATVGGATMAACDIRREIRAGVADLTLIVDREMVLMEGAIEGARGRPIGVLDRVEDRFNSLDTLLSLPRPSPSSGRLILITRGVISTTRLLVAI